MKDSVFNIGYGGMKMYCRKCGKKIEENSKFCPYCGFDLKGGQDKVTTKKQNVQLQKEDKSVSPKKWVIPTVIVAGIAIVVIVAFLGVKAMRKPEKVSKPEIVEEQKEPVQKEQKVEYPQDITLDEEEKQGITDLLDIVSHIEGAGDFKEIENVFADIFLRTSIERGIPFVNGQAANWDATPKDVIEDYLKNSIGYQDYDIGNGGEVNGGVVTIYEASGEMIPLNNIPQISKITQISDEEIEIWGIVDYTESDAMSFLPYTIEFDVVMTKNPDSMWGGYTLKEIKSWEQQESEDDKSRAWKQSFIDYINPQDLYAKTSDSTGDFHDEWKAYKLWDMDQDGVPEVVCTYFGGTGASAVLLAYNPWNNSIMESGLGRFLTYNENELCGGNSIGGSANFEVYTKNADGSLEGKCNFGWSEDTSSDSYQIKYYLNEQEISETEYKQLENKYSQPLEMDMTYSELIQAIKDYT